MTKKQEVRYRTGKLNSGANCGCCIHLGNVVEDAQGPPGMGKHYYPHHCAALGNGQGRGYTVNHDGVCDKFELRSKYDGARTRN